jgi:hypothetical protein
VIPDVAAIAADNRAFLGRAVRYLTSKGVRQFVDLGSGLPTRCNVHEVAQQNAPGTRVVYVDYDPVVAVHGRALLASGGDVAVLHADLTEPSSILKHPGLLRVLDLSRPVGLICASSLHFVADEADPWGIGLRGPPVTMTPKVIDWCQVPDETGYRHSIAGGQEGLA